MNKRTPKKAVDTSWHELFLRTLAVRPIVRQACRLAQVSRSQAYEHRTRFPEFAEQWDEAVQEGIDRLVDALWVRAETVSDTLGIFLLKCHRPEVYAERSVQTNLTITLADLTDDQLDKFESHVLAGEPEYRAFALARQHRT